MFFFLRVVPIFREFFYLTAWDLRALACSDAASRGGSFSRKNYDVRKISQSREREIKQNNSDCNFLSGMLRELRLAYQYTRVPSGFIFIFFNTRGYLIVRELYDNTVWIHSGRERKGCLLSTRKHNT